MLAVGDGHFGSGLPRNDVVGPSPCAGNALVLSRHQGNRGRQGHMGGKSGVGRDGQRCFEAIAIDAMASRWMP